MEPDALNWWQSWGESVVVAASAAMSAVAAIAALRAATALATFEKRRLTLERLESFASVATRTWLKLTRPEMTVLHRLDWKRHAESEIMRGVVEYLNSFEMLAEAWRADALDVGILRRHLLTNGENYPYMKDVFLPAYRSLLRHHELLDALESLYSSLWLRLPPHRQNAAQEAADEAERTTELVLSTGLLRPDHPLREFLLPPRTMGEARAR